MSTAHVLEALGQTVPMAKTMSEKITAQRNWAKGRARNASVPALPNQRRSASGTLQILAGALGPLAGSARFLREASRAARSNPIAQKSGKRSMSAVCIVMGPGSARRHDPITPGNPFWLGTWPRPGLKMKT